ncbi:hypothetical protein AGMMS49944_30230 [Spirochaetia bacterium]|nr:hypothetical protein AGMMS49944_30230 [Spirochaetia bacterium]
MIYVLDACAVVALIKEEPGAGIIQNMIDQTIEGEITLCISVVNLAEVYYGYIRELGNAAALKILERIYAAPIDIVEAIPEPVYLEASRLKGAYKISLADAFGLGTAIILHGVFVTSDGELKEPEAKEAAPVFWFRPPKEKQDRKKVDVNALIRRAEHAEQRAEQAEQRIALLEAGS